LQRILLEELPPRTEHAYYGNGNHVPTCGEPRRRGARQAIDAGVGAGA
jgi:hypothetical protein